MTSDELAANVRADAPLDSTLLTITAQDADPTRAPPPSRTRWRSSSSRPRHPSRAARPSSRRSIDAELNATQAQIDATQAQADILSGLTKRTAEQDCKTCRRCESSLVSLRSTYATLLSFALGPRRQPSQRRRARRGTHRAGLATPAPEHAPRGHPRPAHRGSESCSSPSTSMTRSRTADAVQEAVGLSTLGGIARMKGGRDRSEIYRLATLLYPRSARRRSLSDASSQHRVRIGRCADPDPPRHELSPGRGEDRHRCQPCRRIRPSRPRGPPGGCRSAEAGRQPRVFNLPNADGPDDPSAQRRGQPRLLGPTRPSRRTCASSRRAPCHPTRPSSWVRSACGRSSTRLQAAADLVIFDSPPLQAVTDSAVLSSFLDGTLFVIDAKRSRRRTVRLARETLERAGANLLGVVLNGVPARAHADYGGYYESKDAGAGAVVPDLVSRVAGLLATPASVNWASLGPLPVRPPARLPPNLPHRLHSRRSPGTDPGGITDFTSTSTPPGLTRSVMRVAP